MKNVNDFILPLHIDNENEYLLCVKQKTEYYLSKMKELIALPGFDSFNAKMTLAITSAKQTLKDVEKALGFLLRGRNDEAKEIVSSLLGQHSEALITQLYKSNAFCGPEQFFLSNRVIDKLYLFRGRTVKPFSTFPADEMFHVPLNKRRKVGPFRYSVLGVPCLYLSSNSYVVWNEMGKPNLPELAISSFCFDDELLHKNIIDLTLPIYGFHSLLSRYLSGDLDEDICGHIIKCVPTIPLIIACSVVCDDENDREFYIEYLFPQLMMQFLSDNFMGIAYRSNRISSSSLPANNLAIPVLNFEENKKFGEIAKHISVSDSLNIGYFANLVEKNSSLFVKNDGAKGPSAQRNHQMFSLSFHEAESTFNRGVGFSPLSYDGFIRYADSLFYKFDEYLLFKNELKFIGD